MNFNNTLDVIQSLYKLKEAPIELSQYANLVSGNLSRRGTNARTQGCDIAVS